MAPKEVRRGPSRLGGAAEVPAGEAVMREVFARYFRGDRDGAAALFAADAIFRFPAPGPLHGEYRGRDGVREFWAAQDRLGGRVLAPRLMDLAATRERVFLLVEAGDEQHRWLRIVVYEVAGGAVRQATVFEADPVQAQAYFTSAGQDPDVDVDGAGGGAP